MTRPNARVTADRNRETDVCLIVEGCYPYVSGGVSSWLDWLMRTQEDFTFSVVSIWPKPSDAVSRYTLPPNAAALHHLYLYDFPKQSRVPKGRAFDPQALSDALIGLTETGGLDHLAAVAAIVNPPGRGLGVAALINGFATWEAVRLMYEATMPHASFLDYFWAWRSLFGGLFSTLKFPLPKARVYHAISTGYAGLLAARAALQTGRPALITEHGIYTNERRIEILMADWIRDSIERGLGLGDARADLRDLWIRTFEGYARLCYQACGEIITLYEENQVLQRSLGAPPEKLRVIANGIDLARFAHIEKPAKDRRPTVALIGRVVSIKDVKTFINAAHLLRRNVPDLEVLIMGPTEEERDYYDECRAMVDHLGLDGCVTFTGAVDIVDYLPRIDVIVLTSLSEAQPLVLLEAGAVGIPCVATNVGSCREVLLGRSDEDPPLGPGGIVTGLVAPDQTARAVEQLLSDPGKRRRYGESLRRRVREYYASEIIIEEYRDLYRRCCGAASLNDGDSYRKA